MCENNQYAISVPLHKQLACESIADRAIGYGFPGVKVDGNNPLAVYKVVKEARARAMAGEGPTLIDAIMYRIPPHSTSDNDLAYRTQEEIDEHKDKDGLKDFRSYLKDHHLLSDELEEQLHQEIDDELREAIRIADKAPYPAPEETLRHVYAEAEESDLV